MIKKLTKFVRYLNNYIFKLVPNIHNYAKLISLNKEKNEKKFLDKLYTTNNICESLNSKL